jgi:phage terminase large subunit-like protein
MLAGRGAGKTRAGAEFIHRAVRTNGRVALIAATGADVRDVLLEGESGLLVISPPGQRPHYEPSKRRLTWPNGAVATMFSAEEPDRLRGPEHSLAWVDEAAHFPLVDDVWDNLLFGLRLGQKPRVVVTTTPKPRPWLKRLMADESTRLVRVSTYANLDNLAPTFAEQIIKRYEGTRIGRQEIHGEFLDDVEGALWSWEMIEQTRVEEAPERFDRIIVGVDPAGSSGKQSDETGIVVSACAGDEYYVLADRSGRYSPVGWANAVMNAYDDFSADAIVAEINYGGEMVVQTLRSVDRTPRIITVHAKRAKALRAEPVVSLFEQNRCHIVGSLPGLEQQLAEWVPFEGESPDRLDAMVYGVLDLSKRLGPATISSPARLRLVGGSAA